MAILSLAQLRAKIAKDAKVTVHLRDTTRMYAAAVCGANAQRVTSSISRVTCKRCKAKL